MGTTGTQLFESFTIFQSGQNNDVKILVFDVTRSISRFIKVTPDIDFTDKVIVQCYVPVVKILL